MSQPSPNAPSTNQSTVSAACATWPATVNISGSGRNPESSSLKADVVCRKNLSEFLSWVASVS